jgi:hypothetical protein
MIYLDSHETTLITVNGTTSTEFEFVSNQTQQSYKIDLWTVGITPTSSRKQISFLLQWDSPADPSTSVSEGINFLHVPSGEYTYTLGDVTGLMKLVDKSDPTTYENNTENIVYNG